MKPTLRESDLLEIQPYKKHKLRIGDVILFLPPEEDEFVVHRIIGISPEGIRTRGDNNSQPDSYFLNPANIVGKVIAFWRGDQIRRKIIGGFAGHLSMKLIRYLRIVERKAASLVRPVYHFLSKTGMIACVLPLRLRPRLVAFQNNGNEDVRLLFGRRIIGHYNSLQEQWSIQRPFRLLVDERKLSGFIES